MSKVKLFFLSRFQCIYFQIFFIQWIAGTSPMDSQMPTKVLSSVGGHQNQCFCGDGKGEG